MTEVKNWDQQRFEAWANRNRTKRALTVLTRQLETAERRKFKSTKIELETLRTLLQMIESS